MLVPGYDPDDPRPPLARTLEAVQEAARPYEKVGPRALLGTQASDRMVGEPTTFTKAWFDAFPQAADAAPLLARARASRRTQEIQRMRLANEIAAAAMEHVAAGAPAGDEGERGRRPLAGLRARRGHRLEGPRRARARLLARVVGPGDPDVHRDRTRPVTEHEPTLFEIWVCADGYWCDHTKNVCPGDARPAVYDELLGRAARRLRTARSTTAVPARASPSSTS